MGKKAKTSEVPATWKVLELDFQGEKKLEKDDVVFEEVTTEQFTEKILNQLFQSGKRFDDVLEDVLQWKVYLESRSSSLLDALHLKIRTHFEHVRITLPRPFDEDLWQELETMTDEDLNTRPILINGMPTSTISVVPSFRKLVDCFNLNVKNAEIFPFDVDSYGLPPINCRKILNPLLWLRSEIESTIRKHCQHDQQPINQFVTSLSFAPTEGHLEKLAVSSFFLEKTADNLDYSNCDDKDQFLEDLKSMFGTLKVDELTMVLPDILVAYSEDLLERVMQVSYFIPFELFRLMFICWKPKVLKLKLRTEACSSIEDAARIEWDDEEVFTSTTLFNCPLFDRCEPICLGDEEEIQNCQLIVDSTGSRLFDAAYNESNVDTVGRDFLTLFPMKTIFMKKTVKLKNSASMKVQIKKQIEFIVNTFFFNAEEHQGRAVNYQLTFANVGEVQTTVVKKCVPQTANKKKIGVNFNVDQEIKDLFSSFGSSSHERNFFVSFFDAENQVIVDLQVVLVR